MPVPASSTIESWPYFIEMHVVLPPYFCVFCPGVEIDPRVPQNVVDRYFIGVIVVLFQRVSQYLVLFPLRL